MSRAPKHACRCLCGEILPARRGLCRWSWRECVPRGLKSNWRRAWDVWKANPHDEALREALRKASNACMRAAAQFGPMLRAIAEAERAARDALLEQPETWGLKRVGQSTVPSAG